VTGIASGTGDASGADGAGIGLAVVVPCFNEAEGLERAYLEVAREVARYDAELLFVDDGSTDDTLALIKRFADSDPRVKYLSFSRNFGLEAAFSAGFRYASKPWIVQLDADLQSPPSEIHRLVDTAVVGDYDVVFGVRRHRQDHWLRRAGSSLQHWIARRVLGIDLPQGASTFRVVRASVARKIVAMRLGTPYFLATVAQVGGRYTTVETEHQARQAGRSKFAVTDLFSNTLDLFFGFSLRPLVFVYLSVVAAFAGTTVAALAAPGRTTTAILAGLDLLVLLGLAVVGRYVVGVLREVRPRRYLAREASIELAPEDLLYEPAPSQARAGT
jgi:glycosyltransferase involved in cell wall biosynthesis